MNAETIESAVENVSLGRVYYAQERVTEELCEEIWPLLELHYREIAHYKDIHLDPDFEMYLKLDEAGVLRVYTTRDETKKLIGYSIFVVQNNIHYKSSKQAKQDILFIDPMRRGFGARFILWCDKQLKEEGVEVVYHHVKKAHDFGPMLERFGYELIDLIYGRRL